VPERPLVEIFETVRLESPVLVLALDGWIDAAGAVRDVRQQLMAGDPGRRIARFDTDRLLDHRARRPTLHLVDGVSRRMEWPSIDLFLLESTSDNDVLVLHGPEPDHEWRAFSDAVLDLCQDLGVQMVVGLGAYPAAVPHTRPTRLACTAGSPEMAGRLDFLTATLEVPAGVQAVIEMAASIAGIASTGLWAQVPHYLAASSYPPAALALLNGLGELTGVSFPDGPLAESALATLARLDDLVARNPEHLTMLEKLESAYDDLHDLRGQLPDGEQLAAELERYLRNHGDS
jgi:predicted ATP-grasp superfamily ATP-dependent carboligase|tara:strand:+ start:1207 stop:2073 length:867 start_codon:yes stop_codon:yes gene_type:complete